MTDTAFSALCENPENSSHWLGLKLEGIRSNRGGIGARIEVTVETLRGTRSIRRTVSEGGSVGASPFQ